jgi:hypothetical protein
MVNILYVLWYRYMYLVYMHCMLFDLSVIVLYLLDNQYMLMHLWHSMMYLRDMHYTWIVL